NKKIVEALRRDNELKDKKIEDLEIALAAAQKSQQIRTNRIYKPPAKRFAYTTFMQYGVVKEKPIFEEKFSFGQHLLRKVEGNKKLWLIILYLFNQLKIWIF